MFTIITVSYNSGKTIEKTIKSILSQSFKDFEYIIVDGGSSDDTLNIIRKYEPLFEGKMRWNSERDNGIYNAMNKGIVLSKKSFVCLVNSDDWLEKDALKIVNEHIKIDKDPNNSIYCGWINFFYKDNTHQIIRTDQSRFLKYIKIYRIGINHPATFVPLKIYEKVGLFNESLKLHADADFIIRCYYEKCKFVFVNSVLTNMSDNGVSNRYSKQSLMDTKYILKKYTKSNIEFLYLYFIACMNNYIKYILPKKMLKYYRFRVLSKSE